QQLDKAAGQTVPVSVRSPTGTARSASVAVKVTPDTVPLSDKKLVYNGILLRMQERLREATPSDAGAIRLNLAIVQMRLGQYRQAVSQLEQLQLPAGPGVSGGTVSYLLGL